MIFPCLIFFSNTNLLQMTGAFFLFLRRSVDRKHLITFQSETAPFPNSSSVVWTGHDLNLLLGCCYNRCSRILCFIFKVRAVMGIDFKMIKIHEIVVDSGPICKKSSGKISWELHYFMQRSTSLARLLNLKQWHNFPRNGLLKKREAQTNVSKMSIKRTHL